MLCRIESWLSLQCWLQTFELILEAVGLFVGAWKLGNVDCIGILVEWEEACTTDCSWSDAMATYKLNEGGHTRFLFVLPD